jgi:hypothetical protein
MSLFEVVLIVVFIVCVPLAALIHFPVRKLIDQAGRRGGLWFEHLEDTPVDELPPEDERDAPIPRRQLRGRP